MSRTKTKKIEETPERVTHPVKPSSVKAGDIMAFTYWGKVKSATPGHLTVEGLDHGMGEFQVHGDPLIENASSADQVHETIKASMTEVAAKLIDSPRRPMTVCFEKQDGTERTMRCRLISHEALLGRSQVEDLEIADGSRFRLVDHRTIRFLIVDGVKYEVPRKKS